MTGPTDAKEAIATNVPVEAKKELVEVADNASGPAVHVQSGGSAPAIEGEQ